MTSNARIFLATAVLVVPVAVGSMSIARPRYAFALCLLLGLVAIATRSTSYAVALAGMPIVIIGLLGHDPFPHGLVIVSLAAWATIAVIYGAMFTGKELPLSSLMALPVVGSLAILVLMLARLGDSPDPAYGSFKIKLFLLINLTLLIAGIAIGSNRADFDLLVKLMLLVDALSGIVLVYQLLLGHAVELYPGRLTISPQENPIWLGRAAAEGVIIAVYLILTSDSLKLRRLAMVSLAPLAVAVTASGSRGPVIALVIGLIPLFALLLSDERARKRILSVAVGVFAAVVVVSVSVPGSALSRSLSDFTSGSGISSDGRNSLLNTASHLIASHPLYGVGTGGFAAFSTELYPHNIFLESAAELGVVGLALVSLVLLAAGTALIRLRMGGTPSDRNRSALLTALFALSIINAQLSGDITSNGPLWLTIGLTVGLSRSMGMKGSVSAARSSPVPRISAHG